MAFSKLDVVNSLLGKLGQRPVNDLNTTHPLVPTALGYVDRHVSAIQARPWWFNTEYPTLSPQVDTKRIMLPQDTASVDGFDKCPRVSARGRWLYNLDDSTYEFEAPLRVALRRLLPFEDLPVLGRQYVQALAVREWLTDRDGDGEKLRQAAIDVAAAWSQLHQEHIRSSQRNLLTRSSTLTRLHSIMGGSPFTDRWSI